MSIWIKGQERFGLIQPRMLRVVPYPATNISKWCIEADGIIVASYETENRANDVFEEIEHFINGEYRSEPCIDDKKIADFTEEEVKDYYGKLISEYSPTIEKNKKNQTGFPAYCGARIHELTDEMNQALYHWKHRNEKHWTKYNGIIQQKEMFVLPQE